MSQRRKPSSRDLRRRPHREKSASSGGAGSGGGVGEFIMGRNCIQEVLVYTPHRLLEVYVAESKEEVGGSRSGRKLDLVEQCRDAGVPLRQMARRDLDALVRSDSHQGFIAKVAPRDLLDFEELVELVREQPFARILALDGVVDPQNVGAIFRAAECFGVDAVLWSKNRSAPLGPVVSKVSVGASELLPLCPVANLHRALESLKEAGAWLVGAMVAPDAVSLDAFEFPEKSVVVMGSEGDGVQQLIERSLDFRVYVPMLGHVSSLNVSQATTVMLHEAAKQHRQKGNVKVT